MDISILTEILTQKLDSLDLLGVASRCFGSEYFSRLWIIQGVFQANRLLFYSGAEWLDWSILGLVHSAVEELQIPFLENPFKKLDRARSNFKAAGKFPSLDIAIQFS